MDRKLPNLQTANWKLANWKPGNGSNYVWYGMDRNGRIAKFFNNEFGDMPLCLYEYRGNVDEKLDHISDFLYEESKIYINHSNLNGSIEVGYYALWEYPRCESIAELTEERKRQISEGPNSADAAVAARKGVYIYGSLGESHNSKNLPPEYWFDEVGFRDYFVDIAPTKFASITDIPEDLRDVIAVSDTVDFSKDRIIKNADISKSFPRLYS